MFCMVGILSSDRLTAYQTFIFFLTRCNTVIYTLPDVVTEICPCHDPLSYIPRTPPPEEVGELWTGAPGKIPRARPHRSFGQRYSVWCGAGQPTRARFSITLHREGGHHRLYFEEKWCRFEGDICPVSPLQLSAKDRRPILGRTMNVFE